MDSLAEELEAMSFSSKDGLWGTCDSLIRKNFVPKRTSNLVRPAEESDYYEYKIGLDDRMQNILSVVEEILETCNIYGTIDWTKPSSKAFASNFLIMIGEHQEEYVWTTTTAVIIVQVLKLKLLGICDVLNISELLMREDNFEIILKKLIPKLEGDNLKAYPATLACYKWLLRQVAMHRPGLHMYLNYLVPVTCQIINDHIPANVVTGLECLYQIIQHCHMKKTLIETGFTQMIFDVLEKISRTKEVEYVSLVYLCLTSLLSYMEYWHASPNMFEWTSRDTVLSVLLDNMEYEQNVKLRREYMLSLPQLLTNIGCAKWCERLCRILSDYCEHYTDLETLKATLHTANTFLLMFHQRVPTHCGRLYTAFSKLHFDLTETPVFDKAIMQYLEDCICLLYQLSPSVGFAIMKDDRMRLVIDNNLRFVLLGDAKYFE